MFASKGSLLLAILVLVIPSTSAGLFIGFGLGRYTSGKSRPGLSEWYDRQALKDLATARWQRENGLAMSDRAFGLVKLGDHLADRGVSDSVKSELVEFLKQILQQEGSVGKIPAATMEALQRAPAKFR